MVTVELWVNAFDASSDTWTKVGVSPYLDAQDEPSNYVYSAGRNTNCGLFTFQQRAGTETINSVTLYIYAYGVATSDFECYLSGVATGLGPPAGGWTWRSIDVSSILTTWTQINAATLLLDRPNTKNEAGCDAAYLLIDYVSGPTNVLVSDGLNLNDGLSKERQFFVSDYLTTSDELPLTDRTFSLNDVASLFDAVLKQRTLSTVIDLITSADLVFKERLFQLNDAVNLYDVVFRDKTALSINDSISLDDAIGFLRNLKTVDSLALLDVVNVSYGATQIYVSDILELVDSVSNERSLLVQDMFSLEDTIFKTRQTLIIDSVALADVQYTNKIIVIMDFTALSETVSEDKPVSIEDIIWLSDFIIKKVVGGGWTGKIAGVVNPREVSGILREKIKKIIGAIDNS